MEDGAEEIELRPSSVLRTSTLRSNAARQVVNFMPSRQAGCNTVRLRRSNSSHRALLDMCEETDVPDATDKQADYIVRGMEQHQQLMEDNPLSEELRREALRDLPQGLTMKRNVRAKLSASVSLRSKHRPISMFKRMRYRLSFTWKRMREHFRDFIFSIELWYEAIRTIEGHLGSSVGAYFHLLRWLFCLNLLLSIFVISFIVVPQALYDNASNRTTELRALDFITGQGGLTDSLLFYGHYHNGSVVSVEPLSYYMPHAYFFAMITLYITCFVVLCYKSAYSYRRHFITPHGSGSVGQLLSSKLFCGWDFGVSSPAAAALSSAALYHDFKEILSEQNSKRSVESWYVKVLYRVVKVLIMVLVMGFIGGVQYALWLMMDSAGWTERLEPVTSLVITAVVVICPVIFNLVVNVGRPASVRRAIVSSYSMHFVSLILLPLVEVARGLMYKCQLTAAPQFDISSNSVSLMYNQCVLWFGLVFSPLLVVSVTVKYLLLFYIKKETALRTCYTGRK
ncbi:tmc6 protein, partial [Danaus plexippus plexippus]